MIEDMIKSKIENLFLLFISLSVIYSFNTFYINGSQSGQIISLGVIFASFLILWILKPIILISKKIVNFFIIYLFIALIIIIKSQFSSYSIFMLGIAFPVCIWLTYFLLQQKLFRRFIVVFNNLVVVIALISILFWFLGSILNLIQPTSSTYSNWSHQYALSYYNLYFQPQNADYNIFGLYVGARNSAIFLESPIATFIFGTSIISNDLISGKKSIRIILLLAIITTADTTAFIFVLLYFLSMVFFHINRENKVLLGLCFLFLIVAVIILINMLLRFKATDGDSMSVRYLHIKEEVKAFILSPLYGNGYNSFTEGSSNSITALGADGGILLWGIYYFPLLLILRKINKNNILLIIIFILMFSITVVQYTFLMFIIISFAWIALLSNSNSPIEVD